MSGCPGILGLRFIRVTCFGDGLRAADKLQPSYHLPLGFCLRPALVV